MTFQPFAAVWGMVGESMQCSIVRAYNKRLMLGLCAYEERGKSCKSQTMKVL